MYYEFLSFFLRIIILFLGEFLDKTPGIHYTDIDYDVFSDAAKFMHQGKSPYLRPTYRYSPILSLILIPNHIFTEKFGKILFILFDFFTSILIFKYNKNKSKTEKLISNLIWNFNPLVINISTRGNSDSIISFFLIFTLYFLKNQNIYLFSILYGFIVHFRLFPIFLLPSIFFYLKKNFFKFGFISFITFMILNLIFFKFYGDDFIKETFLYHIFRKDYKHNFAATWFPTYLGYNSSKIWSISRIFLIFILSYFYYNKIILCWTLIILTFIIYNSVCTVQYFDWIFVLLALIPEQINNFYIIKSFFFWIFSHLFWLLIAYKLEFMGNNVFEILWFFSLIIFLFLNYLIFNFLKFT